MKKAELKKYCEEIYSSGPGSSLMNKVLRNRKDFRKLCEDLSKDEVVDLLINSFVWIQNNL